MRLDSTSKITDAMYYFFGEMDLEVIITILENSDEVCGLTKHEVIELIREIFTKFKSFEDTTLIPRIGKCHCNNKMNKGFLFFGNTSRNHISVLFEFENNQLSKFHICKKFNVNVNTVYIKSELSLD